jgi:hypothetical protein
MTHEDCVKITPPQENIDREAAQMGGKESMVRQKLKEIGDVLRQQVVGDFHVAEVQQGAIRGTVVSFIPTAGRSGCTPNESFEEVYAITTRAGRNGSDRYFSDHCRSRGPFIRFLIQATTLPSAPISKRCNDTFSNRTTPPAGGKVRIKTRMQPSPKGQPKLAAGEIEEDGLAK